MVAKPTIHQNSAASKALLGTNIDFESWELLHALQT